MLDVMFVALFTAGIGQPQETTAQVPAAQAAAPAGQQQAAAPQTPAPPEDARFVRECHRELVTGSNLPRLVCRSRLRADLEHEMGQDIMEHVQGSSVERRRP